MCIVPGTVLGTWDAYLMKSRVLASKISFSLLDKGED